MRHAGDQQRFDYQSYLMGDKVMRHACHQGGFDYQRYPQGEGKGVCRLETVHPNVHRECGGNGCVASEPATRRYSIYEGVRGSLCFPPLQAVW